MGMMYFMWSLNRRTTLKDCRRITVLKRNGWLKIIMVYHLIAGVWIWSKWNKKYSPKFAIKQFWLKEQKRRRLRHIFRDCGEINCVNVEDLNFNHIHRFGSYQICENHNSSSQKQYVCAKSNAILLQNWCKMNSQ